MSKSAKDKIIAVVGVTASGKTNMAVALSLQFGGEVVSADSRQVYKHMDIGSGKDLQEYEVFIDGKQRKIPYHLIDVAHPNEKYDLAKWLAAAKLAVDDIVSRRSLPVVAGGTGLYAQALLDGYELSEAVADTELRLEMGKYGAEELFARLHKLDKKFAQSLNESERLNKRRLIRHIEVISNAGKYGASEGGKSKARPYDDLILGIDIPREIVRKRIRERIVKRLDKEGMLEEVKGLHDKYEVPWESLESFGLEYRYLSYHLQGRLDYMEMVDKLHAATCQFAKRQMTWLRRWEKQGAKINWVAGREEASDLVGKFLQNNLCSKKNL